MKVLTGTMPYNMTDDYLRQEKDGPRINQLLSHFSKIALGQEQKPLKAVIVDPKFTVNDPRRQRYAQLLSSNTGMFNSHAFASIPYFFEETVRLGLALNDYAKVRGASLSHPLTFWSTSSADASHARTLAEFGTGTIVTLSDTPNSENAKEFERLISHQYSQIIVTPYFNVTQELVASHFPDFPYRDGFDVIWEDTTFQMYSSNRDWQISHVKKQLAIDGMLVLFEKVANFDQAQYILNEYNKDLYFKTQYFSRDDILSKNRNILKDMFRGQVTESSLSWSLNHHFNYVYKIWHCGNFVQLIASNSHENIESFLNLLSPPYTPTEVAGESAISEPVNLTTQISL